MGAAPCSRDAPTTGDATVGAKDPVRAKDIVLACRLSRLPVPDLWRRYVELGGNRSPGDLTARLVGQQVWPAAEDGFLAVAVDEALLDAGLPSLVGAAPVDVRQTVPARPRAGRTAL